MLRNVMAALLGFLLCQPTLAGDHVWIIGGGPEPDDSQVQIELNVKWVVELLRQRPQPPALHVYFTDGNAPGKDVRLSVRAPDSNADWLPLARIFESRRFLGDRYRNHRVPGVIAGTEARSLMASLGEGLGALKDGDRAFILYNGHGLRDARDSAGNTLRLWSDTRVSARELERLLGRVDVRVPVRFLFTQCYSGGFSRLVHPQARDVLELAEGQRCGFMAEAEDREAEGCSASIESDDYRDYTTFFFAALSGRTRSGAPITGNVDLDHDGVVTPDEAHLYVLRDAQNADLPRSTSEVYLERWQPWYLRWLDTGAEPDNVYGRIAREVTRRAGLPESGRALTDALIARRSEQGRKLDGLKAEQTRLEGDAEVLRTAIQRELVRRWPEIAHPYTRGYVQFLQDGVQDAQAFALKHPRYPELVAKQDRLAELEQESLHLEREMTQLDKVRRLRKLARLLAGFERHASAKERSDYARLKVCERLPF